MKTSIKQIDFTQLMKEFNKYVAKTPTRPVLQYVHYDGEYYTATNAHIMLRVNEKYVSNVPEDIVPNTLYDPKLMEVSDDKSNYPDTDRLIPNDCNLSIRINNTLNEIQSYIRAGNKQLKGKWTDKNFKFTMQDDYLEINPMQSKDGKNATSAHQYIMRHNDFLQSNHKEIIISLNSRYITNALITVKKLSRLSNENIEMNVIDTMRPIHFKQDDVFNLIVLPVRLV